MVFVTGAAAVATVGALTVAEESVGGVFSLAPPPQEIKKNAMAAQNSKPLNLNCFIVFDFKDE
jgi:hypothetical protein